MWPKLYISLIQGGLWGNNSTKKFFTKGSIHLRCKVKATKILRLTMQCALSLAATDSDRRSRWDRWGLTRGRRDKTVSQPDIPSAIARENGSLRGRQYSRLASGTVCVSHCTLNYTVNTGVYLKILIVMELPDIFCVNCIVKVIANLFSPMVVNVLM